MGSTLLLVLVILLIGFAGNKRCSIVIFDLSVIAIDVDLQDAIL